MRGDEIAMIDDRSSTVSLPEDPAGDPTPLVEMYVTPFSVDVPDEVLH